MACGLSCTCRAGMGECETSGPCHTEVRVNSADRRRFESAEQIAREVQARARAAGLDPARATKLARQAGCGALIALESGQSTQSARRQAMEVIASDAGPPEARVPQRAPEPADRPRRETAHQAGRFLPAITITGAAAGLIYWILKREA